MNVINTESRSKRGIPVRFESTESARTPAAVKIHVECQGRDVPTHQR